MAAYIKLSETIPSRAAVAESGSPPSPPPAPAAFHDSASTWAVSLQLQPNTQSLQQHCSVSIKERDLSLSFHNPSATDASISGGGSGSGSGNWKVATSGVYLSPSKAHHPLPYAVLHYPPAVPLEAAPYVPSDQVNVLGNLATVQRLLSADQVECAGRTRTLASDELASFYASRLAMAANLASSGISRCRQQLQLDQEVSTNFLPFAHVAECSALANPWQAGIARLAEENISGGDHRQPSLTEGETQHATENVAMPMRAELLCAHGGGREGSSEERHPMLQQHHQHHEFGTVSSSSAGALHQPQQQHPLAKPMGSHRPSTGSIACQDCGNQAKKDCSYMRCRTCCKTRGFDCPTHVSSTWVPASKRRERQQLEMSAILAGQPLMPKSKRARNLALQQGIYGAPSSCTAAPAQLSAVPVAGHIQPSISNAPVGTMSSTSTGTPPRSSHLFSLQHGDVCRGTLPREVRTQAVFKCIRLTRLADGHDEYAYHGVVKIGGRTFKGVLYDQGAHSDIQLLQGPHGGTSSGEQSMAMSSALIDIVGGLYPGNDPLLTDP